MQKDLTTGSVFKNVLYFSLPYLLSYFLQTLYGMADLFIIGQFEGTASITAVSIGSQIMHMITVMLVGLAMGVTVGIGRAVGAHDDRGADAVIGNAVMLFLAVSVVLAMEPVTPMPIFSPFISLTGTMLMRVRKSEDSCMVFIRVWVTDGSTVNFFDTSPASMPFSSATRDR